MHNDLRLNLWNQGGQGSDNKISRCLREVEVMGKDSSAFPGIDKYGTSTI
ncbi:MAG: hypothetical protein IPP60_15375 [Sphingobacteriales bacterium]|nr:hypothetical protein [Sphingobacteriales bacterium]